jgi:hypothetical protein
VSVALPEVAGVMAQSAGESPLRANVREFLHNRTAVGATLIVLLVTVMATAAPAAR